MSLSILGEGLQLVLQPGPMLAILLGCIIGLVMGVIPGLGGGVALSVILGFVVFLDPVTAIALMVSIYATDQFGGSVTGILLNIPGTGGATATAVEGHELAKQGRAGEAIAIGRSAAFVGSIVGAVVLLLLAPFVARWALQFGPAEYVALALFGVTVIASLAQGDLLKSMVSGLVGFAIATIGYSSAAAYPRFTFGSLNLNNGLNIVWVIVGLFAITQAFALASGSGTIGRYTGKVKVPWGAAWPQLWKLKRFVAAGSGTGLIIGMIPGAGATIAAWLAYGQAQRLSPNPERFGHGAIEGVVAPEAANDSVAGGTLIPTMTLGIPGSADSAIILSGLILVGMRPGPRLFTDQAPRAVAVMLAFLIANLVFLGIVVLVMRYLIRILAVPTGAWPPLIVALGAFGAYAIEQRFFGVYATLAVGALGYLMLRNGYPLAPALLAFVLGPILEANLTRLRSVTNGDMLSYVVGRPIAMVFLVLAVLSLGLNALQRRKVGVSDEATVDA